MGKLRNEYEDQLLKQMHRMREYVMELYPYGVRIESNGDYRPEKCGVYLHGVPEERETEVKTALWKRLSPLEMADDWDIWCEDINFLPIKYWSDKPPYCRIT